MFEWFNELRFDHPRFFWGSICSVVLALSLTGFMLLPNTPLNNALGVGALQRKVSDLYYAGFWFLRVQTNGAGTAVVQRTTYGNVIGLDRTGGLVAMVAVNDDFVRERVSIADVRLVDLRGAAEMVRALSSASAKFEFYEHDQVVVWIDDMPLNVKLIEKGLAVPDPNPPTNIVDKAFATYYWRAFYGTQN